MNHEAHEVARRIIHEEMEMDRLAGRELYHAFIRWKRRYFVGVLRNTPLEPYVAVMLSQEPLTDEAFVGLEDLEPNRPLFMASDELDLSHGYAVAILKHPYILPASSEEVMDVMASMSDGPAA